MGKFTKDRRVLKDSLYSKKVFLMVSYKLLCFYSLSFSLTIKIGYKLFF